LDTIVTSTPGISSRKRFFLSPNIFLSILDELEELGFGGNGRNLPNQRAKAMDSIQDWR
jgi:hypothetical protein